MRLGRTRRNAPLASLLVGALASMACQAHTSDEAPSTPAKPPVVPTLERAVPARHLAGASAFCKRGGRPMHGAVAIEWQSEDRVRRLSVDVAGHVARDGNMVASVSGMCLWGMDGRAVLGANSNGELVGPSGAPLGTFKARAVLRIDGDDLSVDEVLILPDGSAKAIAADGSVYLAPRDAAPFSLPARVTGDVARGRRTAFMLFAFGQGLSE